MLVGIVEGEFVDSLRRKCGVFGLIKSNRSFFYNFRGFYLFGRVILVYLVEIIRFSEISVRY